MLSLFAKNSFAVSSRRLMSSAAGHAAPASAAGKPKPKEVNVAVDIGVGLVLATIVGFAWHAYAQTEYNRIDTFYAKLKAAKQAKLAAAKDE